MVHSDLVDIDVEVITQTASAYLVWDGREDNNGEKIKSWLPKSQVEYDAETESMAMPEWLAVEKGMV